jgi:hypothetical protein
MTDHIADGGVWVAGSDVPEEEGTPQRPISRRSALALIAGGPVAAALVWTPAEAQQAHEHAQAARAQAETKAAPF